MESQITIFSEYSISSVVSDIKNIESQTLNGVAVIKIYFHPSVKIDAATAQVTAVSQTILRRMPPGTQPPFIIRYNASNVPILQLSLSSKTLSESQLYDYGIYKIRSRSPSCRDDPPAAVRRQAAAIMVDLDSEALLANGLSAQDVNAAVTAQNFTLPTAAPRSGPSTIRSRSTAAPTPSGAQRRPRQSRSGQDPSTCATSRRSTTASRCRPTWCGRTDVAPCC